MVEWLILLLLVPAIVVPVVMLVGFGGCSEIVGIDPWRGDGQPDEVPFAPTFGDESTQLTQDDPSLSEGWKGFCLVQRIEPARLKLSGIQVRLTLRASATGASIDRIYISEGFPEGEPGINLWDSAGPLTPVHEIDVASTPVIVPVAPATTLVGPIDYALDKAKPLLIAVDFTSLDDVPLSGISYLDEAPGSGTVAFYHSGPEAALSGSDRSDDYTPLNGIYLIEMIEVR